MKLKPIKKGEAVKLFALIDERLKSLQKKAAVTLLGGIAIIMQDIRDRATLDFDIAPTEGSQLFRDICESMDIHVDIITVASTVDLAHAPSSTIYQGEYLTAKAILPEDLLRLKLERFYKQDPEDIYAIIDRLSLSYETFKEIVSDMLPDYIGNPRTLLLSALQVIQIKYPACATEFEKKFLNLHV